MLKDFLLNEKKKLRLQLKTLRNTLSEKQKIAAEKKIAALFIMKFSEFINYGAYYPINNEVNILPIMQLLSKTSKILGLPCVYSTGLLFRLWQPGDLLSQNKYAFEPVKTVAPMTPEVILTPLLGFDRTGHRLGYGGGRYDHYFSKHKHIIKVGIAFACQEIDHLPREAHDQRLDFIITEKEIISCS